MNEGQKRENYPCICGHEEFTIVRDDEVCGKKWYVAQCASCASRYTVKNDRLWWRKYFTHVKYYGDWEQMMGSGK